MIRKDIVETLNLLKQAELLSDGSYVLRLNSLQTSLVKEALQTQLHTVDYVQVLEHLSKSKPLPGGLEAVRSPEPIAETYEIVEEPDLVKFFHGTGTDDKGRTICDILNFSNEQLESVHDYIQWLFPTPTPSQFNPKAPILIKAHVGMLSEVGRQNYLKGFERMLAFYGFMEIANGRVLKESRFEERSKGWLTPSNHNYLRITRILESLTLMGFRVFACNFLFTLKEIAKYHHHMKTPLLYWEAAVYRTFA